MASPLEDMIEEMHKAEMEEHGEANPSSENGYDESEEYSTIQEEKNYQSRNQGY